MTVAVFGATGATGRLTVADLLDRGDTVTVHARNPGKIPAAWAAPVRTVVGEVTDPAPVAPSATAPEHPRPGRPHPTAGCACAVSSVSPADTLS